MLTTNYRNHSEIFGLWNQHMYGGDLHVGNSNDAPDRVGNAWDVLPGLGTSSKTRRCMASRLFLSTIEYADRHQNSLASYNGPQVHVLRHLLSQPYQFETTGQGEKKSSSRMS
jgi:superfamily I DNA and/or RNA helicase